MVLIPLRATILSLCITIVSVICEVAFLTAALCFIRYHVCQRLKTNKKISVRFQHLLVVAVTLFAMLAFVVIESVTSILSEPTTIQVTEIQPCVRNMIGAQERDQETESEAILFACAKISGTTVSHFEGNFSLSTSKSTCAQNVAYSYVIGELVLASTESSVLRCVENICVFVKLEGSNLFLSGPQKKSDKEVNFSKTTIDGNLLGLGLVNSSRIADSLLSGVLDGLSETGETIRNVLVGSIKDQCPFTRDDGPGTTVPLGVIIGAASFWGFSLMFFFVSLFVRPKIFFDITHTMHWARQVRHDAYRGAGTEPELQMEDIDGERRILITGYMHSKDGWLP